MSMENAPLPLAARIVVPLALGGIVIAVWEAAVWYFAVPKFVQRWPRKFGQDGKLFPPG